MKRVEFSETIAASDLKVSRCRYIIAFMKVCEYYWPKVVYIQKFKPNFLRTYFGDLNQKFLWKLSVYMEIKI